ncbi:MAG: ABC transporter ATP-binding protein [Sedimentisphaerales bacterium]|nr:ABC transporter ATP-binding protein [Sedimentisphaerales bacterium]
MSANNDIVLRVENLRTYFETDGGIVRAVDGVTFSVKRGKTLALVGESGCGKSVTAYSILRLIQKPGKIISGRIMLHADEQESIDILSLSEKSDELYDIRGGKVSMIFQEPMTALSPVHTVGNQICEAILLHQDVSRARAREIAIKALGDVGIPSPQKRIDIYPHEISGGMRQRVVIAMALVCRPQLLIADEPTTALDVTIQAQIIHLIKERQRDLSMAVMLITHDLGVVAQSADDVAVMYLGRIVEQADIRDLMKTPRHPYTMGLLKSLPSLSNRHKRLPSISGSVPSPAEIPTGCPFHPRCPYCVKGLCDTAAAPELTSLDSKHSVACLRANDSELKL